MLRASTLLTKEEITQVNKALADTRQVTSVKIVPVIATSSGRYDRAEDMVGLWAAALGLALLWLFFSDAPVGDEWTAEGRVWKLGLLPVLTVVIGGFVAGAALATHLGWLRRLFVPRVRLEHTAEDRSRQVYADTCMRNRDSARTEVLVIYVSLYERYVVLLTETGLRDALGDKQVEDVRDQVTQCISRKYACAGLCAALVQAAEMLSHSRPATTESTEDPNPPRVRIMDQ